MISVILILSKMQCIYISTNLQTAFSNGSHFTKYALLEIYLASDLHCTGIALTTNILNIKKVYKDVCKSKKLMKFDKRNAVQSTLKLQISEAVCTNILI